MRPELRVDDDGRPLIAVAGRPYVVGIEIRLAAEIAPTRWTFAAGNGALLLVCRLERSGVPVARATLRADEETIESVVELLAPLYGTATSDAFGDGSISAPEFGVPPERTFLAATFGLAEGGTSSGDGYWPEVLVRRIKDGWPGRSFAPAVFYDEDAAVAVAPGNGFLTGALVAGPGHRMRRGIHGTIDHLPAGARLETLFVAGADPIDAVSRLGDRLLERGGKRRPSPADTVWTSRIGWWNAYGSWYTEPLRPLDARGLRRTAIALRRDRLPVGYLGIDLWYPYERIGRGIRFAPDPEKYPDGIGSIVAPYQFPTVLHLSALAPENAYGTDGADPEVYAEIAERLRDEGAIAAWHDWLRTQQAAVHRLRSDPEAAEAWFVGMARRMETAGLDVLLCMQTMGMVLGSTACPNVVAARSSIDYLFSQAEALAALRARGAPAFADDWTPPGRMRRQNLLTGSLLYALGLLPFYDLFLTSRHPGLGGGDARAEAALRALSCGPVGIGDAPDRIDHRILARLVGPDGLLLRPDRPPVPDRATLGGPVEVYRTEHCAGDLVWRYVIVLNATDRPADYRIDPPDEAVVIWNGLDDRIAPEMAGVLEPGGLAYFVLSPRRGAIAPLGLCGALVPAPAGRLTNASSGDALDIEVAAPGGRFAVWSERPIRLVGSGADGRREGALTRFDLGPTPRRVLRFREVRRR